MKKPQEPQIDLEAEYRRLSENEKIYHEKISLWEKLWKITIILVFVSFVLMLISLRGLPENTPLYEAFPNYPFQTCLFFIGFGLMISLFIVGPLVSSKNDKVRNELGLHREERLFLRAYVSYKNINSYLNEPNLNRKLFLKKLALKNTEKMIKIVKGWKYGNIKLIRNLIGDQIDLLKDNMKRLVLSNVAKGDEKALKKISEILIEFCKHIHSPSIEELDKLNNMIKELPYKEYKVMTKKEKIAEYFYGKPRAFRLLFASSITIIVASVLFYLHQNIGLIVAVGVTCFWGAFTGFDKLFGLKKE